MRRPGASFFQTSLHAAWSAWYNLDSTMRVGGSAHIDDIKNDFDACAESITQVCVAIRPGGISDGDRVKIDQILLGEENNSESSGLEELLEKWEMELNLSPSEKTGWDAMATQVKNACEALARI
jgi:hypothetical protein